MILAALLAGCATQPVDQQMTVSTRDLLGATGDAVTQAASPSRADAAPGAAYRIGSGDILRFRCFDDPSLDQGELIVRYDGSVSLPQVADVEVAGLTREEAEDRVSDAFLAVFKEPAISLTVISAESKSFFVLGDVMEPSEYPYRRGVSVLEAINLAGGQRYSSGAADDYVSQQGSLIKAFILRHQDGQREVIECDLRQLTFPGAHPADTPVVPGDIVFVPAGVNLVYVLGEVGEPSVFQLAEGQTLTQLLARAGSTRASTARMRHVVLMREIDEQHTDVMTVNLRRILRTGQDIPLEAGDVIFVPRRPLVRIEEFVARFTGSISPLLSLYTQAWETGYTKKRLEYLYDNPTDEDGTLTELLREASTYSSILQGYQTSVPTPPAIPELPE